MPNNKLDINSMIFNSIKQNPAEINLDDVLDEDVLDEYESDAPWNELQEHWDQESESANNGVDAPQVTQLHQNRAYIETLRLFQAQQMRLAQASEVIELVQQRRFFQQ